MPKKLTHTVLPVFILMFILALSGCKANGVKIGWRETSGLSHKTAKYVSFDGADQVAICVEAGQNIALDYEVTVEKGTLNVALNGPDDTTAWQETFSQDAADTVTVQATDTGCYALQFTADHTRGSLDFSWKVNG